MPQPNTNPALGIGNADIVYAIQNTAVNGTADGVETTYFPIQGMAGYNGSTFDRFRAANKFTYFGIANTANASETLVYTPASGKKFRLLSIQITTSGTSTGRLFLRDGSGVNNNFMAVGVEIANNNFTFDFQNGYLSKAANNSLYIYQSIGTGSFWVTTVGTEE